MEGSHIAVMIVVALVIVGFIYVRRSNRDKNSGGSGSGGGRFGRDGQDSQKSSR